MSKLPVLLALALLITQNVANAATSVVRRTTLLVADIEQSIDFYERIGFRVWLDRSGPRDPEGGDLPLNAKPGHSRIVVMSGQNDAVAMIGLLAYDHPPLAPTREPSETIGITDAVLVVQTDDIGEVHQALVESNARIIKPPRPYTVESVNSTKHGVIMFVADPDGHVIELTEVRRVIPFVDGD